jgi:uncharacterized membrane protein YgcG
MQQAAERRALRADYRDVYSEVVEGKEQLANAKSTDLQRVLGRVQSLHERAQRPKEYAVDAEVFAQLAACGLDMVRRGAASSKKRMPADFVAQLKAAFALQGQRGGGSRRLNGASAAQQPQEINWAALGLAAVSDGVFSSAPGAGTMHGPLGEAPKPPSDKKKAAAAAAQGRRKRSRLTAEEMEAAAGPKVVPREVTDDLGAANPDGDDKQETDRQMDTMWEALMERADPDAEQQQVEEDDDNQEEAGVSRTFVDVAALVVNHESFAQTVENMFTLSFLVRDQRVRLEHDPSVGLVVRPFSLEQQRAIKEGSAAEAAAVAAAAGAGGGGGRGAGVGGRSSTRGGGNAAQQQQQQQQQQQRLAQQFVVRFTHEDWEIMKAIVPRGQAVTPHRVLGEGLEREERRAREDAAAAQQQERRETAARGAARREEDARDEERRAAQRARRQSERERMEKELQAFDGMEQEEEGDENVEAAGGVGGGSGGGGGSKKRARGSGGGGAAGGGGDGGVVDLVDDVDVVDHNRTGKAMRV